MLKHVLFLILASLIAVLLHSQLAWVLQGVHHIYGFFFKNISEVANHKAWVITCVKVLCYVLMPFALAWLMNIIYWVLAGHQLNRLYTIIWILWIIFTITLTCINRV